MPYHCRRSFLSEEQKVILKLNSLQVPIYFSLEYHYMRIVEGKEDLMAVNSCALNDEEDDENEEDAPTASSNKVFDK